MKFLNEDAIQHDCISFLRFAAAPEVLFHHNPNENKLLSLAKNKFAYMKRMAALGLEPGVLDISMMWIGHYAEIELKYGKNKPNADQLLRIKNLTALGHHASWTNSLAGFIATIKQIGVPLRHRSGNFGGIVF